MSTPHYKHETSAGIGKLLVDRFRCPEDTATFGVNPSLSGQPGFFRFGPDCVCFGHALTTPIKRVEDTLPDVAGQTALSGSTSLLPFDPVQVLSNFYYERYVPRSQNGGSPTNVNRLVSDLYYSVRPYLPVSVRKHLQRIYLRRWDKVTFPKWPVDSTVETFFERLLALSMKAQGVDRLPFIWFWPDGAPCCTMVTHDVETQAGLAFCPTLMDLNDSFGIKTAFQVVPEERYVIPQGALQNMWDRGFEVNVQDLNHDGHLYRDHQEFLLRSKRINEYGKEFGASGFRAGVLYRNPDWYGAFQFSYDMSVPNVAHLDPQRGGCCTVLPFFYGDILELPVTTIQDYSLFQVLNDYSIELWKTQFSLIRSKNGLVSTIVHPDYIIEDRARRTYVELLHFLAEMRARGETWIAKPGEIASWWRQRQQLTLVRRGDKWMIEGEGSERARVAYAVLTNGGVRYELA